MRTIRVGNASGFYGDRAGAWVEMLTGGPLDVLTGDYLAELTMLILGRDRLRDPRLGYARGFLRQLETALGLADDKQVKIVTNAGGLNPAGLAQALRDLAARLGLSPNISSVEGDALDRPGALTANAYLGAFGIAECLRAGADIVVTGRVTDASLVVGPAIAAFGWGRADLPQLAGATVAGHIVECGTQATGGNYSFFTEVPDLNQPGFPIAEISEDGSSVITKHPGTGGMVTVETVTAQLLYEIAGPHYLGPDVITLFDTIHLDQQADDRVSVTGTQGLPPPPTLKVGVNTLGGFRNSVTFILCGLDITGKAALVRRQLEASVGTTGLTWRLARTDHPDADTEEAASALLTATIISDDESRAGRAFSGAAVELTLSSVPGLSLTAPPGGASPFGVFTAETVPQAEVAHVAVLPDGTRVAIDPPPTDLGWFAYPSSGGVAAVRSEQGASTRRVPLGRVMGARSGDKGGDANLGVWARSAQSYEWLRRFLTEARLKQLLPECAPLAVRRHELPNLHALNFVIPGLLGAGVAASTRFDPQAKALGEWLRSRVVGVPEHLL